MKRNKSAKDELVNGKWKAFVMWNFSWNSRISVHALRYDWPEPGANTELFGIRIWGTIVGNSSARGESSLNRAIWNRERQSTRVLLIPGICRARKIMLYRKSYIKPPGALFFSSTFERGGLFKLAKRITCSKNLPPVYQQLSRSRTSWTFAYRIIISAV